MTEMKVYLSQFLRIPEKPNSLSEGVYTATGAENLTGVER